MRITPMLPITIASLLVVAMITSACSDSSDERAPPVQPPVEPAPAASARIAETADLLSGPLARGVAGDYVLENDLLRVIIQQPGRQWLGVGTYGGNIIDSSARQSDGSFFPDHLEEFVSGINIENTPHYTQVAVDNRGDDGNPARICASGPDDLLEFVNASYAVSSLGFDFPASADDRDLPLEIETCYSLSVGDRHITIDTTLRNTSSEELPLYHVEYLSASGQVEAFQPLAGFGEPLLTPACPVDRQVACTSTDSGMCDQCTYMAFSGIDGAAGVSYGLIHEEPGSSSFAQSGVNVVVLGEAALELLLGIAGPNFLVPAEGELTLRRYFAVGDGTASSIADIRNELLGVTTGMLSGQVSTDTGPLAGAEIAVYQQLNANTSPPALFMAGHSRSDSDGRFRMTLPPGDYYVRANKEGYLFPAAAPAMVTIETDAETTSDFELPATGFLEVTVIDDIGPGPAKLQLVGFDPSPQLKNLVGGIETGVFGDTDADQLPYGVAAVHFIDREGSSGRITIEPGEYQLVVSRGPRFSVFRQMITIAPGETTSIQAEIVQVLNEPGFVHGDFHVHAIDSPDSEVTREERVATYLAEGMDFFTPSDHGVRTDFRDTLEAMGVSDLIGTASSSETTTFDYGHFNSWPTTVDPTQLNGGALDWGREGPVGMDFPEYGSYLLSPAEIIAGLKADPMDNLVQINHIASHFGGGGLAIDTGLTPPRSFADLASRRLDPALGNAFDAGFDALEVWIGTNGRSGIVDEFLNQNAGDWFNLINQGIVRRGIANSDSHDRRFTRISARNLIASEITDPVALSAQPEQLAASVRAGKSIGSNAPLLLLEASGNFAGEPQRAGLRAADNISMAVDSDATLTLVATVATPAWAQVDTVEFYINNQPALRTAPGQAARYAICPDQIVHAGDAQWRATEVVVNDRVAGASRTEIEVTLTLPALTQDTWVVAIARGSDGVSEPLFPVLPASLNPAGNGSLAALTDGNLGEGGTPAFAFTNPLFIDVGGDGWTAPGVHNGDCKATP